MRDLGFCFLREKYYGAFVIKEFPSKVVLLVKSTKLCFFPASSSSFCYGSHYTCTRRAFFGSSKGSNEVTIPLTRGGHWGRELTDGPSEASLGLFMDGYGT